MLLVAEGGGHSCGEQSTDGGPDVVVAGASVVRIVVVGVVPEVTGEDVAEQAATDRATNATSAALRRSEGGSREERVAGMASTRREGSQRSPGAGAKGLSARPGAEAASPGSAMVGRAVRSGAGSPTSLLPESSGHSPVARGGKRRRRSGAPRVPTGRRPALDGGN